jgi:uncharacterized membrane protein
MKIRLRNRIEWLRTTYWVVPAAMLAAAAALSVLTGWLDANIVMPSGKFSGWLVSVDVDGAREFLSTIASSMIAVAGVVFSITIVALSIATSQFGPRLLNNFIRDSSNKVSLGTFTATFLYCVLVLRTIRAGDSEGNGEFVPHLGVSVALLLAIAGLGVLIYFIHHVAASIRASHVIALVGSDLQSAIERRYPEAARPGENRELEEGDSLPTDFDDNAVALPAGKQGYLQAVDDDVLTAVAKEHDLLICASVKPGDFVVAGVELVRYTAAAELSEELKGRIDGAFLVGRHRTAEQDIRLHFNQLAEVAIRALSPGINDPFTAMTCIDWLGAALCDLASRRQSSALRYDDADALRLVIRQVSFGEVVEAAFSQIRHYGRDNRMVILRMVRAMALIEGKALRPGDREALVTEARALEREALKALRDQLDDDDELFAAHAALMQALGEGDNAAAG